MQPRVEQWRAPPQTGLRTALPAIEERAGPGTDIALIRAFPRAFEAPAPFFRIRHPGTLTAGGVAVCVPDVYASEAAATAVMRVAGTFLRAVRVPMA